jgi:hypothetical protein
VNVARVVERTVLPPVFREVLTVTLHVPADVVCRVFLSRSMRHRPEVLTTRVPAGILMTFDSEYRVPAFSDFVVVPGLVVVVAVPSVAAGTSRLTS